jgi:L,D-peptidoglycan transpeptidase YkuD (ErfK/YbiS/YcfS/YnhG family)
MGGWRGRAVAGLVAVAVIAGCGGGAAESARVRAPVVTTTTTTAGVVTPASTGLVSPVDRLFGVGDAEQVISVIADAAGDTTAVLAAYERTADGWVQVHGPWKADIGAEGFAPANEKREGDHRTPTGAYDLGFAFGVLADPGLRLDYRRVTSEVIVWDDDPASSRYNQWVDTSTQPVGQDPEPMYNRPAYNYGVVIAYNTEARTPGAGSAIFLHVADDGPTAGCVAIPQDDLVALLRWLDPAKRPRIVMGTRDSVVP